MIFLKLTKYLPQFGALLLLAGMTVPVFCLADGYFDRQPSESSDGRPGAGGDPSVTDKSTAAGDSHTPPVSGPFDPAETYAGNLNRVIRISQVEGLTDDRTGVSLSDRVDLYRRLLSDLPAYAGKTALMAVDGYDYAKYELAAGEIYELPYVCGSQTEIRYSRKESNSDASYVTVATPVTVGRKSVQPYMGYLLISTENGGKITLCDSFGGVLCENIAGFEPYYARDFQNRPVFVKDGVTHVFNAESGQMTAIDPAEIRSGLFYDYPALPVSANGYEAKFDPESGYMKYFYEKTGKFRLSGYYKAYNFSEGLAVVMQKNENFVRVINTSGSVQFQPDTWYRYHTGVVGQVMNVGDIYTLPDTFGIESMGVQGYDHGWLRLRVRTYSQNSQTQGKIVRDSCRLVDTKGNPFEIPEGYTLEGYSDGVLLLQKNGLYGYYSIDHKWIAQPIYSYATPFIQGLAVLGFADGTVGMIDTAGNIVLPFVFTSLSTPSSGVIVGYCEGIGYQTFYLRARSGENVK